MAEAKRNRAPVARDFPRCGKSRLDGLGVTVEPNQDTTREIANLLRSFVIYKNRVKGFRLAVQAKVQLATGLRAGSG